jgi:hypothetical protein
MYSGPPVCQDCGGALMFDTERCRCGGESQYSGHQSRQHLTQSGALDDGWSDAAEQLLQRELETRQRPLHWTEAMAMLQRRYVPR